MTEKLVSVKRLGMNRWKFKGNLRSLGKSLTDMCVPSYCLMAILFHMIRIEIMDHQYLTGTKWRPVFCCVLTKIMMIKFINFFLFLVCSQKFTLYFSSPRILLCGISFTSVKICTWRGEEETFEGIFLLLNGEWCRDMWGHVQPKSCPLSLCLDFRSYRHSMWLSPVFLCKLGWWDI